MWACWSCSRSPRCWRATCRRTAPRESTRSTRCARNELDEPLALAQYELHVVARSRPVDPHPAGARAVDVHVSQRFLLEHAAADRSPAAHAPAVAFERAEKAAE